MPSMQIVIPSRKRPHNVPHVSRLLPDAVWCVADAEADSYAAQGAKVWPHPNIDGLVPTRNWILDNCEADCVVQIDDDFDCVWRLIGKAKRLRKPEDIAQIIDNAWTISEQLDIGVFCWSRTRNTFLSEPVIKPFRFVQPIGSAYGMRGKARDRRLNPELVGRADCELTLETLRDDRILLCDSRFYFDFGYAFSGRGGNVGRVTETHMRQSEALLTQRWGKAISFKKQGYKKDQSLSTTPLSIRVKRQSPLIYE